MLDYPAVALSGSGRELAVALRAIAQPGPVQLRIYSVTTGKLERAWSTRDQTVFGGGGALSRAATTALTWVDDDRALAFPTQSSGLDRGQTTRNVTHETMRLLDMSAGGSDLIADSRVIWSTQAVTITAPAIQPAELREQHHSDAHRRREDDRVCRRQALRTHAESADRLTSAGRWTLAWLAYSTSAPTVARTVAQVTVEASTGGPLPRSTCCGPTRRVAR